MASRLPPLNPLRAFEAAARLGSISRAAGALSVTHGAVSHQVRTLEMALDVRLFHREGNRLRLTAQGAALLPRLTGAFEAISLAVAGLAEPSTEGDLTVSCVPALLALWLVPRLDAFTEPYPGLRLRLIPSNDPAHIGDPDIDLCIRYGSAGLGDCWLSLLAHIRLFPVCSPSLLNTRPLRVVGDLAEHVLLHADAGREWQTWLAAADAGDLARGRRHFLSDAHLAIAAAAHGTGVALGDTVTTAQLLSRGDVVVPFDLSVPAADAFFVACRPDKRANPLVRTFIDWLVAAIGPQDAGPAAVAAGWPGRRGRLRRSTVGGEI